MLEIIKYGTSKYGVWVVGHLKYDGFDILDIFNTNISDEEYFANKTQVEPKVFKITRNRQKQIVFTLEF